jgi:hypothetical protein
MLTKAIVAHREGKRVFVVALDQAELRHMIDLLHKFGFKPPASRFMLCTIDRLDPTYGLRGPDAVVFLDHAVEHVAKSIPNPQLAMLRYMGLIAT